MFGARSRFVESRTRPQRARVSRDDTKTGGQARRSGAPRGSLLGERRRPRGVGRARGDRRGRCFVRRVPPERLWRARAKDIGESHDRAREERAGRCGSLDGRSLGGSQLDAARRIRRRVTGRLGRPLGRHRVTAVGHGVRGPALRPGVARRGGPRAHGAQHTVVGAKHEKCKGKAHAQKSRSGTHHPLVSAGVGVHLFTSGKISPSPPWPSRVLRNTTGRMLSMGCDPPPTSWSNRTLVLS